ncbi:MAG: hypothetical protein ACOY71_01825 [Gemmatimonadota bacterium]
MKKTYLTPAVVLNGSIVRETKTDVDITPEFLGKLDNSGGVGFNL